MKVATLPNDARRKLRVGALPLLASFRSCKRCAANALLLVLNRKIASASARTIFGTLTLASRERHELAQLRRCHSRL